jgi:hypothetical protein
MNLDVEVLADAAELRDEALQANLPHYFTVTADGLAYCPDASMPAVLSAVRSVLVDPERVTVKIACGGSLTLDCPDYMVAHARAAVESGEAFRLARALNCVQYLTAYEEKYQGDDQFIGPDWLAGWGIP